MALNRSALLIRDYENIRRILRDIYIFGCFSKEDFIESKGISGRKYDKEQQRITSYLPEGFLRKRRADRKVLLYCSYQGMDGAGGHLADTYRNKTFTALDVMAYFFVQQLLNEGGELTAAEILEALPARNGRAVFTKDNLRIKLEELAEKGFIRSRREGRSVLYSLSPDIWRDFRDEELQDICTYLEFMMNVSPLETPYYFLYRKLRLYLWAERGIEAEDREVFRFKHNHLFNSLDNDIMLEILRAVRAERLLRIDFYGAEGGILVVPAELIHDSIYGRQYLYCLEAEGGKARVVRLDRIRRAAAGEEQTEAQREAARRSAGYSDECWCTSGTEREMAEIVAEFYFDEEKEGYILDRIRNESHGGSLRRRERGVYEFRLALRNPDEMIPWIRSFGERARVVSSGGRGTEGKLAEDWRRALEKYDSL